VDDDGSAVIVDPRIERTRQVVRQAVLDELGDVGFGSLTIESVAARAGVGKSTIYRHWPDRLDLIADAFESAHEQMVPDVEAGSVRQRVGRLIRHVAEVVVDSTFSRCIPALIEGSERDPRLRRFHHDYSSLRRQSLIDLIAEGVRNGEFEPSTDPELSALSLLGTIFYSRLMTSQPFQPEYSLTLVDAILRPSRQGRVERT
jgi:TetR/AcrR family transcriptional regulator of autoinduction and epiphytic fitness